MNTDSPGLGARIRRAFSLELRRRHRWEKDVEDEIRLHIALRAEQLVQSGRSEDDATREAIARFGPLHESRRRLLDAARHREEHMQRTEWFRDLRQDFAFALRVLRRQPGWTAITVLTLALGIGATTAVFSVVSSLLLHAIPYPNASEVVAIDRQPTAGNQTGLSVSVLVPAPVVRAWRENSHTLSAVEPYRAMGDLWITGDGTGARGPAAPVHGAQVGPGFPAFAGAHLLAGRVFTSDEAATHAHVVLISSGIWRSQFAQDHEIAGKTLTIEDSTWTIIGVVPASLTLPSPGRPAPQLWLPLDVSDDKSAYSVVGRLREGATIAAATRELDSISARLSEDGAKSAFSTRIVSPSQLLHFHDTLVMLMGAVALVLLVACVNVAHLQLARGAARARELAVRIALGAGRWRLTRHLVTESLLVTLLGAALGVGVAWAGLKGIIAIRPPELGELGAAHLDGTTLFLTALVAIVSGVVFGTIGVVQSARQSTHDALKEGSLASSNSRGAKRLRFGLVAVEMAMSATLLVGASLLIRSVIHMQGVDIGFDPNGLYAIQFDFPRTRYTHPAERSSLIEDVEGKLHAVPGVASVAVAHVGPGGRSFALGALEVEGEPPSPPGVTNLIDQNQVSRNFFSTLGIRVIEGTTFTDTSEAANQVIVNAGFARKHWATVSAVGGRIRVAYQGHGAWKTIVGVVADAAPSGMRNEATAPLLYLPHGDQESVALYVRQAGTTDIGPALRELTRSSDPMLHPVLESVAHSVSRATAAPRLIMMLLLSFTMLAVVLASIGLYGVMAYGVAQESREIGIRVALGATRRVIASSVLSRGLVVAASGAVAGLIVARWSTKLIEHQLFGVTPTDVVSSFAAVITLVVGALLASVIPTRRALAIDPMRAIRAD